MRSTRNTRPISATDPPPLAALAYDAVSLAALLAPGEPYHRFTPAALTDPNGFAGVDGIFRFNPDGTVEARTCDHGGAAGRISCGRSDARAPS